MAKGISPIIATILLIVMTVGIAALMYAWMTGLFGTLSSAAGQQVAEATRNVIFNVPAMYMSGGTLYAIIYNGGNVPIDTSRMTVIAVQYYSTNSSSTGTTSTCSPSSTVINPNTQVNITLNCSPAINTSAIYYYEFTFTYLGVPVRVLYNPSR